MSFVSKSRAPKRNNFADVYNRLSTIDLNVPGGGFVVTSDDNGQISPDAQALLGRIPIPWVTSAEAGWDPSLSRPGYKRFAPRVGLGWRAPGSSETMVRGAFGIFLNQWADSVQQAFARNLPFFFTKNVKVASDVRVPTDTTQAILTTEAPGTVGGSIMDWDYRVEYNQTYTLDVQRLLTPRTSVEVSLMASRTIGADSSTVRNVPLPRAGGIAARRPVPKLGSVNAIRWDGMALYHAATFCLEHRLADGLSVSGHYTWSKSMDDASDPEGRRTNPISRKTCTTRDPSGRSPATIIVIGSWPMDRTRAMGTSGASSARAVRVRCNSARN